MTKQTKSFSTASPKLTIPGTATGLVMLRIAIQRGHILPPFWQHDK